MHKIVIVVGAEGSVGEGGVKGGVDSGFGIVTSEFTKRGVSEKGAPKNRT